VLDCGIKAISGERGLPTLKDVPDTKITALHAEHALLELGPAAPELKPGDKLQAWVHYSDGTVNLHTTMHGVRHGQVEEVFRVEH
jgi:D-serine deaminase-like pyridoxal phosphate-dependent protein